MKTPKSPTDPTMIPETVALLNLYLLEEAISRISSHSISRFFKKAVSWVAQLFCLVCMLFVVFLGGVIYVKVYDLGEEPRSYTMLLTAIAALVWLFMLLYIGYVRRLTQTLAEVEDMLVQVQNNMVAEQELRK